MKFLTNYLDDILPLAGCICILYGLSMWNIVVTWIIAGVMLIVMGLLIGKVKARK